MNFDSKVKELAKAHDAVDRLQEIQDEMELRAKGRARLHDRVVRATIFALTVLIVAMAIWRL